MECTYCKSPISGKYYYDIYRHSVCACHVERGEVVQCYSCGGYTANVPANTLRDGRQLCATCMAQATSDPQQIERIKKQVIHFIGNEGFVFKDRSLSNVPVIVSDAFEIARLRGGPVCVANKGVTFTRVQTTLLGAAFGRQPSMSHTVHILDHLIKADFASTLGHELMHIWQKENGVELPPQKCEGLCNLGSWIVLDKFSSFATPYLKRSMMESPDPVYGDGFRYVYQQYEQIGIDDLIEQILKGRF